MNTLARETSAAQIEVAGGVDTHQDTHTAAVVDQAGRMLGHRTFPTTEAGYGELLAWLGGFGRLRVVGVEGTGAYGAGALHPNHAKSPEPAQPSQQLPVSGFGRRESTVAQHPPGLVH